MKKSIFFKKYILKHRLYLDLAELKGCEVQTVCVYVNCFCDQPKLFCLFSNKIFNISANWSSQVVETCSYIKIKYTLGNLIWAFKILWHYMRHIFFFYPYLFKTDKHFLLYLFKYFSCKITTDKYATLSYCELVYVLSAHGK